jgi:N-methylhydantoinase A
LNASISGTFLELKEQIEEGCKDFLGVDRIYYLSARKKVFQNEKQERLGSLFSTRTAIVDGESHGLLYLGLEKFSWISAETENFWKSPWGLVELQHPVCVDLQIQPTCLIDLNIFGEMDFSAKVEGYEPGPMCMGRGQKPTLLDLYAEDAPLKSMPGVGERLSATGIQRFKSTLQALAKITKASKSLEHERLGQQLRDLALQRLALEVNLQNASTVQVRGPLAALLGPGLKKLFPHWHIDGENFEDSLAVAVSGCRWKTEAP